MNALLVKNGEIERIQLSDANDGDVKLAHEIHELIGGGFSPCFHVPGRISIETIVGFCIDDFRAAKDSASNVVITGTLRSTVEVIVGPIVIVGHHGPSARPLTEIEMAAFRIAGHAAVLNRRQELENVAVLTFLPGYDLE